MIDLHVLSVAGRGIFLVGGDIDDRPGRDREIFVILRVACPDFGALGIKGNGHLPAGLRMLGCSGIVLGWLAQSTNIMGRERRLWQVEGVQSATKQ